MLSLSSFLCRQFVVEGNDPHHIGRIDPADGTGTVGGRTHLAIGRKEELGGLDDAAPLLPPRAELFGLCMGHAVRDREREFSRNFFRLVDRIHACGEHFHAERIQLGFFFFEADQLPATVRSPMAAIEKDDLVARIEVVGHIDRSAVDEIERKPGEDGPGVEFFSHGKIFSVICSANLLHS